MAKAKGSPKTGGRVKGTPNKLSANLKQAILDAAEQAGGPEGTVGYLRERALDTPGPFLALLGKVLPSEMVAAVTTSNMTKEQRDAVAAAFLRRND